VHEVVELDEQVPARHESPDAHCAEVRHATQLPVESWQYGVFGVGEQSLFAWQPPAIATTQV
jgi:hypothetical protein